MNRDNDKLNKRREYVRKTVNEHNGKTKDIVRELSDSLFVSEATIWKDLKASNSKEENHNGQNRSSNGKFTAI